MKAIRIWILIGFAMLSACNKNHVPALPEVELQNEPPLSFNLLEVPDRASDVELVPNLSWESAQNPNGGEVTYDLYLGKESNPTSLYQSNISNLSFQIQEKLDLISEYHWKVVAKDKEGQTSQSGINSFTTRNLRIPEQPLQTTSGFPLRINHTSLSFENKIWVLSGNEYEGQGYNDVWSSEDGSIWNESGNDVLLRTKFGHTSLVYDNKMWILGGWAINEELVPPITHDVWTSGDGINWDNMTSYTDFFPARTLHSSVVFNDKIYVIGGHDDNGGLNDIWQYDGTWNQVEVLSSFMFTERYGHSSVVYDNKIWVIGGFDGSEDKNDVWYSSDGANWTPATLSANFPPIAFFKAVVYGGKMWLVSIFNKYWYSEDGINWTSVDIPEELHGRYGQSATIHDGKLYLTGGIIDRISEEIVNDVWILE